MKITLKSIYKEPFGRQALYDLLKVRSQEDDPYTNISHRVLPKYRKHVEFVKSVPYRAWVFVKADDVIVGTINITKRNEIGIIIHPDHRGKGIGKVALKLVLAKYRPRKWRPSEVPENFVANINPKNERSIRLFESLGFKHIQNTYTL